MLAPCFDLDVMPQSEAATSRSKRTAGSVASLADLAGDESTPNKKQKAASGSKAKATPDRKGGGKTETPTSSLSSSSAAIVCDACGQKPSADTAWASYVQESPGQPGVPHDSKCKKCYARWTRHFKYMQGGQYAAHLKTPAGNAQRICADDFDVEHGQAPKPSEFPPSSILRETAWGVDITRHAIALNEKEYKTVTNTKGWPNQKNPGFNHLPRIELPKESFPQEKEVCVLVEDPHRPPFRHLSLRSTIVVADNVEVKPSSTNAFATQGQQYFGFELGKLQGSLTKPCGEKQELFCKGGVSFPSMQEHMEKVNPGHDLDDCWAPTM